MTSHSQIGSTRRLAAVAITILVAAGGAGCGTLQPAATTTGSVAEPAPGGDPRQASQVWGERYRADPRDPVAAIN